MPPSYAAQLESGRVFRLGFGFGSGSGRVRANNFYIFRAEFGFIFCSSRNVLRISLEEIGKSGQNRVFVSLVGFGSGFGQQGSGSGRVEKLRPDSNSGQSYHVAISLSIAYSRHADILGKPVITSKSAGPEVDV